MSPPTPPPVAGSSGGDDAASRRILEMLKGPYNPSPQGTSPASPAQSGASGSPTGHVGGLLYGGGVKHHAHTPPPRAPLPGAMGAGGIGGGIGVAPSPALARDPLQGLLNSAVQARVAASPAVSASAVVGGSGGTPAAAASPSEPFLSLLNSGHPPPLPALPQGPAAGGGGGVLHQPAPHRPLSSSGASASSGPGKPMHAQALLDQLRRGNSATESGRSTQSAAAAPTPGHLGDPLAHAHGAAALRTSPQTAVRDLHGKGANAATGLIAGGSAPRAPPPASATSTATFAYENPFAIFEKQYQEISRAAGTASAESAKKAAHAEESDEEEEDEEAEEAAEDEEEEGEKKAEENEEDEERERELPERDDDVEDTGVEADEEDVVPSPAPAVEKRGSAGRRSPSPVMPHAFASAFATHKETAASRPGSSSAGSAGGARGATPVAAAESQPASPAPLGTQQGHSGNNSVASSPHPARAHTAGEHHSPKAARERSRSPARDGKGKAKMPQPPAVTLLRKPKPVADHEALEAASEDGPVGREKVEPAGSAKAKDYAADGASAAKAASGKPAAASTGPPAMTHLMGVTKPARVACPHYSVKLAGVPRVRLADLAPLDVCDTVHSDGLEDGSVSGSSRTAGDGTGGEDRDFVLLPGPGPNAAATLLAISPKGKIAAYVRAGSAPGAPGALHVVDMAANQPLTLLDPVDGNVSKLALSNKYLAAVTSHNRVAVYDIAPTDGVLTRLADWVVVPGPELAGNTGAGSGRGSARSGGRSGSPSRGSGGGGKSGRRGGRGKAEAAADHGGQEEAGPAISRMLILENNKLVLAVELDNVAYLVVIDVDGELARYAQMHPDQRGLSLNVRLDDPAKSVRAPGGKVLHLSAACMAFYYWVVGDNGVLSLWLDLQRTRALVLPEPLRAAHSLSRTEAELVVAVLTRAGDLLALRVPRSSTRDAEVLARVSLVDAGGAGGSGGSSSRRGSGGANHSKFGDGFLVARDQRVLVLEAPRGGLRRELVTMRLRHARADPTLKDAAATSDLRVYIDVARVDVPDKVRAWAANRDTLMVATGAGRVLSVFGLGDRMVEWPTAEGAGARVEPKLLPPSVLPLDLGKLQGTTPGATPARTLVSIPGTASSSTAALFSAPATPQADSIAAKAIAPGISEKEISRLLDERFQRLSRQLEQAQAARAATELERQEALLRVVSETLANNVSVELDRVVSRHIKSDVVPALTQHLDRAIDRNVKRAVESAMANAPKPPPPTLPEGVVGKAVRDEVKQVVIDNLIPGFERASAEMFKQIAEAVQRGVQQTVAHATAASQQQQQPGTPTSGSIHSAHRGSFGHLSAPGAGSPLGAEPHLRQLALHGQYEAAFSTALSGSGGDLDPVRGVRMLLQWITVDAVFPGLPDVPCALSPGVLLHLLATLSTALGGSDEAKVIAWLEACVPALPPRTDARVMNDPALAHRVLALLNSALKHLEAREMQLRAHNPGNPSANTLRLLTSVLRQHIG